MRMIQSILIFLIGLYLGAQFGAVGLEGIVERVVGFVEQLEGRR